MNIQEAQTKIIDAFSQLQTWEDKYKYIIQLGKALPPLPAEYMTDKYKVNGCQSQVWLYAQYENGKVHFIGDSDAMIVKGLLALLLSIFSDKTSDEIMTANAQFITDLGLNVNLSQSRSNGVAAIIKQMKLYAFAFHSLKRQ